MTLFRSEHYKLKQVIDATFQKEDGKSNFRETALRDMQEAYLLFEKTVNVLDITKEGQDAWDQARKQYDTYTAKIENQLTLLLK